MDHKGRPTCKSAAKAHEKAAVFGLLVPVNPVSVELYGAPVASPGRVYVTRTGQVFHPVWRHSRQPLG